jgi:hypothetical protein
MSIPGQTMGVSVFTDILIEKLGISRLNLSLTYMVGNHSFQPFYLPVPVNFMTVMG